MRDFVIKRRRKRTQMNTECLDVRDLVTVGLSQSVVDIEEASEPFFADLIPDIVTFKPGSPVGIDVDAHALVPVQVSQCTPAVTTLTVGGFLRKPVKRPRRTYQKRRLATTQFCRRRTKRAPGAYKDKGGTDDIDRLSRKHSKTRTTKQKKTRLAQKLSRAMILTHGDPPDMIQDPDALTRRPLTFVTINKFTSPPRSRRPASEKDEIIHGLDSPNDMHASQLSINQVYVPRGDQHTRKPPTCRSTGPGRGSNKCLPLCFIPVREAEAAYASLFS